MRGETVDVTRRHECPCCAVRDSGSREGDWLDVLAAYVGNPFARLHDFGPHDTRTFSRELRIASPGGELTPTDPLHPAVVRLLDAAAAGLARVNGPLTRSGLVLSGVLVGSMLALALAQIGSRALFNYTLDWAEESARFALVWTVLAAAPYAYRRGQHVAIDAFAAALPPRLRYVTSLLLNLLVLAILARFLFEAIHFWERGLSIVASAVPMPMAWIYSIVPVSFAAMLLVGIELSCRLARSLWRPDPQLTLAGTVAGVTAE